MRVKGDLSSVVGGWKNQPLRVSTTPSNERQCDVVYGNGRVSGDKKSPDVLKCAMLEFIPCTMVQSMETIRPCNAGSEFIPCTMVQSMETIRPCNAGSDVSSVQGKCDKTYEMCEGCGQKIHDRYLMRVADGSWHEHCLSCTVCGALLSHSCYCRNGKLYCKMDYDRLFGVKCSRCGDRLHPHEMVMRAQTHVFHLPCFTCVVCCQPLQKGEQFVLRSGQLFCRQDFEKEMFILQQSTSPSDEMLLDENSRPRDGRRGPKRPRTILTSAQRRQFKASFEVSPKPCRKVREALAKETGLSVRVVQVWFQNQRAKMKKIQRKAKQDSDKSPGEKEDKREKCIKQEPLSSDHSHYLGLNALSMHDSSDSAYPSSSQPLNPNHPYSPDDNYPAHSGESFCSSDISLDDSTNLDEGGSDTLSLELGPPSSHEGILHNPMAHINPIDKLYLMQNSYFSSAEQ